MAEPETQDMQNILDEALDFIETYLSVTRAQAVAMVLYAAATWALPVLVTMGRLLFVSENEESGKTLAMMLTAALCANPEDVAGTAYALQSALAAASNSPEIPQPTLYCDEISDIFGRSGLGGAKNPIAEVLRKGYKYNATKKWSVNRVPEVYSIFTPFLMTGLKVAVPRDIRSRCIVITMHAGKPRKYFDVRTGDGWAARLAETIGKRIANVLPDIKDYRAYGMHPKLIGRKLEVWEPLFAVAQHLGGQQWVNMCMAAFTELTANGSSELSLSPRQQLVADVYDLMVNGELAQWAEKGFIPGEFLADAVIRLPLYADFSPEQARKMLADELVPMGIRTHQHRGMLRRGYPVDRMSGYYPGEITAAWDQIRPDDPEDVENPGFEDPFDVSSLTDDQFEIFPGDEPPAEVTPKTPGRGGKGGKAATAAEPVAVPSAPAAVTGSARKPRAPRAVSASSARTSAKPRATSRARAALPAVEQKFLK